MVTKEFVLNHMQRKSGHSGGGQWNDCAIFYCSTDLGTDRPTMSVARIEIDHSTGLCIPPFTETIFIDETSMDQFHDFRPPQPN